MDEISAARGNGEIVAQLFEEYGGSNSQGGVNTTLLFGSVAGGRTEKH